MSGPGTEINNYADPSMCLNILCSIDINYVARLSSLRGGTRKQSDKQQIQIASSFFLAMTCLWEIFFCHVL